MKSLGGKLVNRGFTHNFGQKLESSAKFKGTHTVYNTAKVLQPENNGFLYNFGQKLESAAKIAGTLHTIYNTAKVLQPYVAGALRISTMI